MSEPILESAAYQERTAALFLAAALEDSTVRESRSYQTGDNGSHLKDVPGFPDCRDQVAVEGSPAGTQQIALSDCPPLSVDHEGECPDCGHPVDEHWHRSGFWCADCIAQQMVTP